MALVVTDRVQDTTTTTGTGTITLAGTPPTRFRAFSSVLATNDTFPYAIIHQTQAEWEIGLGTLASSTTFTRTTVYSSSTGSAVSFSAGTKDVFIVAPGTPAVQASVELGHPTDTTVTRASAGDVAVEGNIVYRAGGTDVAIADGGTASSSIDAARNALLAYNGPGTINCALAISAASSALTITLQTQSGGNPSATDPTTVIFRNVTATLGTYTPRTVTAATSLVISSGSTLGVVTATAFRLWVVGFDDAATFRLGVINCRSGTNIFPLQASGIASSTAEGGAGAADSAQVFYTGTAVTSKAYVVLGFVEWNATGLTAGTWTTTNLSLTQLIAPGTKMPNDVVQRGYISTTANNLFTTVSMVNHGVLALTLTQASAANLMHLRTAGGLNMDTSNKEGQIELADGSTSLNAFCNVFGGSSTVETGAAIDHFFFANSAASKTYRVRGKISSTAANLGYPGTVSLGSFASLLAEEIMA